VLGREAFGREAQIRLKFIPVTLLPDDTAGEGGRQGAPTLAPPAM
jgi:hypothetical protein